MRNIVFLRKLVNLRRSLIVRKKVIAYCISVSGGRCQYNERQWIEVSVEGGISGGRCQWREVSVGGGVS